MLVVTYLFLSVYRYVIKVGHCKYVQRPEYNIKCSHFCNQQNHSSSQIKGEAKLPRLRWFNALIQKTERREELKKMIAGNKCLQTDFGISLAGNPITQTLNMMWCHLLLAIMIQIAYASWL
ncbi:uncharacterized protein LOC110244152 [Exaiptasia diaphana]|uniref:Uncharacterized protein n=1 Tax=Exaiptasia diaphana TaxID=2652724 RepID=A0A913YPD7_EXADI|nr:uncharacterized protein LOC110244152 [Exaiptasia diaphana]